MMDRKTRMSAPDTTQKDVSADGVDTAKQDASESGARVTNDVAMELLPVDPPTHATIASAVDDSSTNVPMDNRPRWEHWRVRKLARIWMAVMLTLNIEPTVENRAALKAADPDRYQLYRDRLDIATTLAGVDLDIFEDHVKAGDKPGETYVEITDLYDFAVTLGWQDLEPMKIGLKITENAAKPMSLRATKSSEANRVKSVVKVLVCAIVALAPEHLSSKASFLALRSVIKAAAEKQEITLDISTIDQYLVAAADEIGLMQ